MAGWLHGGFVDDWLFVFPLCGFSLSLFCNYHVHVSVQPFHAVLTYVREVSTCTCKGGGVGLHTRVCKVKCKRMYFTSWLVAWGLCGCMLIRFSAVWLLPFTLL